MRVVFMGTPDFAVPTLNTLIASRHEVAAVVTQPDRPKGRGKHLTMPPVKETALAHGIPVLQPERIRHPEVYEQLKDLKPDVIIVAAFGQIIPGNILTLPRYGCLNVHASLLPKYRGASPIQWAILNGDDKTGITIMQMQEGLDTGDILLQQEVALTGKETGGSLFDTLSGLGGPLVLQALSGLEAQTLTPVAQDEEQATHVRMLTKAMGQIDWKQPAATIERLIRGLDPWPAAYTTFGGKTLKLWKAGVVPSEETAPCGTVLAIQKDGFVVQTGKNALLVLEVQLEGKKRMEAAAFLRGVHLDAGILLG